MLELRGIRSAYGGIEVLHGIDLVVGAGEIGALIGANGAGKSTCLMGVSGIVPPVAGSMAFEGREIAGLPPHRIVSLGINQVPEGRRIFPDLTVAENLDMGAYLRRDGRAVKDDLDYVFELFPILAERRSQEGGTLSGGEQQMLAISRALMARPRLLLLDEPSMGLAPQIISRIFSTIEKINREQGTTIFLVEQNANQALRVAHRGYVMENGTIVMSDSAGRLMKSDAVRRAYLGL